MKRVLIVDDEVIVRAWLKKCINWNDCKISVCGEASNGREALEVYKREKPDIILTDLRMPVLDGKEFIQCVRKQDKRTRFVILTCIDEFNFVKEALNLDVTGYILKMTSETDEIEKELIKARRYLEWFDSVGSTDTEAEEQNALEWNENLAERQNPRLLDAKEYIEKHYTDNISLFQVANYVGVSPNYLGKLILKCYGHAFTDELNRMRIKEAKRLLKNPSCRIYEVAEKTGFPNVTYFYRIFKKYEGCTPTEYRVRGKNDV